MEEFDIIEHICLGVISLSVDLAQRIRLVLSCEKKALHRSIIAASPDRLIERMPSGGHQPLRRIGGDEFEC